LQPAVQEIVSPFLKHLQHDKDFIRLIKAGPQNELWCCCQTSRYHCINYYYFAVLQNSYVFVKQVKPFIQVVNVLNTFFVDFIFWIRIEIVVSYILPMLQGENFESRVLLRWFSQ